MTSQALPQSSYLLFLFLFVCFSDEEYIFRKLQLNSTVFFIPNIYKKTHSKTYTSIHPHHIHGHYCLLLIIKSKKKMFFTKIFVLIIILWVTHMSMIMMLVCVMTVIFMCGYGHSDHLWKGWTGDPILVSLMLDVKQVSQGESSSALDTHLSFHLLSSLLMMTVHLLLMLMIMSGMMTIFITINHWCNNFLFDLFSCLSLCVARVCVIC